MQTIEFEYEMGDAVLTTIGVTNIESVVIGLGQFEAREGPSYLVEWVNGNLERCSEWVPSDALAPSTSLTRG